MAAPEDPIVDKVSFIMNNLTQNNVTPKAKDLTGLLLPDYVEWFANYLVVKRASQVGCCLHLVWCELPLSDIVKPIVFCVAFLSCAC